MVSLAQHDAFLIEVEKDPETGLVKKFLFNEKVNAAAPESTPWGRLFNALVRNDRQTFLGHVDDLSQRKLSAKSEWIHDDCMVLLLLVGNKRFTLNHSLIGNLLQARRGTTNPQRQTITQVFESIHRGEFAMEGEFAFIKFVFRTLTESWSPVEDDCGSIFNQITRAGFFASLDSFWQLVAVRAFHLVFNARIAGLQGPGTIERALAALQENSAKLTVGQLAGLLKRVRVSVIISLMAMAGVVVSVGFMAGRWWEHFNSATPQNNPSVQESRTTRIIPATNSFTHTNLGTNH
ncbi:MAG: hypothetical protein ACXWJB_00915 [Limisphaerales bacterium]